ncbi:MAG: class I SAM-dependent methyltransferase [Gemmatimonadales bacterium]
MGSQSPQHPVQFFDSIAREYDSKHYGTPTSNFMTLRQDRVLEFVDSLGLPRGAKVLDAGCGPGHLVQALVARGLRVCAIDAAGRMVAIARARFDEAFPSYPPAFHRGSIEELPYRESAFDLVCSTGVIEYLAGDDRLLGEAYRVLRPGGHLILSVTNRWSPINWLDFMLEFLKRRPTVRGSANRLLERTGQPVRARPFKVRRHTPSRFRATLARAGFQLENAVYFHFLPWPHPFDRLFPTVSASLGSKLERFGKSWIGPLAEGYLTHSVKLSRP